MPREIKVSPVGELMWAKVLAPGIVNQGKPDEKEQWSVDLLLSKADAEAQAFVKMLKEEFIASHGSASRPGPHGLPFKAHRDYEGNETDLWQFTFKRSVRTLRGVELSPPAVQDAKGTSWPTDVLIGNGSTGKVAFHVWSWSNSEAGKGISLGLEGLRILHLVEYAPPNPAAAFGDPEDGFEVKTLVGTAVDQAFSSQEAEIPF